MKERWKNKNLLETETWRAPKRRRCEIGWKSKGGGIKIKVDGQLLKSFFEQINNIFFVLAEN